MEKSTKIEALWLEKAREQGKTIVLPEAGFSERIVNAGIRCAEEKIAKIVLLVTDDNQLDKYNLTTGEYLQVVNVNTHEMKDMLASALYEKRKAKGMTMEDATKLVTDPVYFGTMMVDLALADGLVAGAEISTAETFKPAFQLIKGKTKDTKVSSFFVMVRDTGDKEEVYILSDCGINIDPSMEEIVEIAKLSAESARTIGMIKDPKVALLSYSTKGSAEGEDALKMREAKAVLDTQSVDFVYDGEMQLDAAIVPSVAALKAKGSPIQGDANVLVFPNLSAGNIGYKLMQRFGGFQAFGPIAQGMRRPINDVSRGANVNDIVQAIAITALQD
ncbi:MAG: phosphate acetyltransferase [Clostridiales bacterium]|nr:phosphate acetyltransferase [Clostridiales bacterium]